MKGKTNDDVSVECVAVAGINVRNVHRSDPRVMWKGLVRLAARRYYAKRGRPPEEVALSPQNVPSCDFRAGDQIRVAGAVLVRIGRKMCPVVVFVSDTIPKDNALAYEGTAPKDFTGVWLTGEEV